MDELYVVARGVLLDALDALGTHRNAVVLVGAQAVYLRVGEADLAVAPFTTDGDLTSERATKFCSRTRVRRKPRRERWFSSGSSLVAGTAWASG